MIRALFVAMALAVATPSSPCGPSAVCGDVGDSFYGTVVVGGVRADWSTDAETVTLGWYRLERYLDGDPVQVATIYRTGSCGTLKSYLYVDDPPDPDADWTYRLTVVGAGGADICTFDVEPQ